MPKRRVVITKNNNITGDGAPVRCVWRAKKIRDFTQPSRLRDDAPERVERSPPASVWGHPEPRCTSDRCNPLAIRPRGRVHERCWPTGWGFLYIFARLLHLTMFEQRAARELSTQLIQIKKPSEKQSRFNPFVGKTVDFTRRHSSRRKRGSAHCRFENFAHARARQCSFWFIIFSPLYVVHYYNTLKYCFSSCTRNRRGSAELFMYVVVGAAPIKYYGTTTAVDVLKCVYVYACN